jgi:hypothetical protein
VSIKFAGAAASVLALAALTAGCSAKTATTTASSASSAASSVASSVSSSAASSVASPVVPTPVDIRIPVTIAKGVVTPNNGEYEAKVGQRIEFDVESDAADELHVHAVPEHEFEVKPGSQTFSFVVKVPGQVVVELHSSDKTVATLTVK